MGDEKTERTGQSPLPKCVSILLCENFYPVARSQNFIIVNFFHQLRVPHFPMRWPVITTMFTLTNGHGHYDVLTSLARADGVPIVESRGAMDLADPLMLVDHFVQFRDVSLVEPGRYWAEMRCNGELVGQLPFHVVLASTRERRRPTGEGMEV